MSLNLQGLKRQLRSSIGFTPQLSDLDRGLAHRFSTASAKDRQNRRLRMRYRIVKFCISPYHIETLNPAYGGLAVADIRRAGENTKEVNLSSAVFSDVKFQNPILLSEYLHFGE